MYEARSSQWFPICCTSTYPNETLKKLNDDLYNLQRESIGSKQQTLRHCPLSMKHTVDISDSGRKLLGPKGLRDLITSLKNLEKRLNAL